MIDDIKYSMLIAQILQQRNYAMVQLSAKKQLLCLFRTAVLNICNVAFPYLIQ